MTSWQHAKWLAAGGHWQVAEPILQLVIILRYHGYTVYTLGDKGHLDHVPPEDHTPYSETGWPIATPYGWVTACDIMPPPAKLGLPSLQELGDVLTTDRQAGLKAASWIKYVNWGPVDNRHAVHDSWMPKFHRKTSGDVGHVHLSCRSDKIHFTGATGYDPVARLRGEVGHPPAATIENGDEGMSLLRYSENAAVFLTDGRTARHVGSEEELADLKTLISEGYFPGKVNPEARDGVRVVGRRELIGRILDPVPAGWEDLALNPLAPKA